MGYRDRYVEDTRDRGCGCGRSSCGGGCNVAGASAGTKRHCVKDVVRRILEAQREVAGGGNGYDCDTSCDRAIDELLSPSRGGESGRFTTIPFMLFNKKVKPFYGAGFYGHGANIERRGRYECIESPVFKVQGFVRGSNNCVRLELLLPVYRRGRGEEGHDHSRHHDSCGSSICNYFGHRIIENWRHTGVCITVDLDCFCGISCLDPTTPREFSN